MASLRKHFTRTKLNEISKWWFEGVPTSHGVKCPQEVMSKWFRPSQELDNHCADNYGPAAEEALIMNIKEIQEIVSSPEEACAAVVLLDQIPRNIFRGKAAKRAYAEFDPKAVEVAKIFLGKPYEYGKRHHWSHFNRSMFLYLPLMHSEDPLDHDLLAKLLQSRREACNEKEEYEEIDHFVKFEKEHRDVLDRFGRYPARNEALGRETTSEEEEYLKNGGGWSAARKEEGS